MGLYKYSVVEEEGEKWGKAQVHDVDCSYKDLSEVFSAIRGKTLGRAETILNEAISLKKAIPYRTFARGVGHRSELGGHKGRYPKKECKIALQLLDNARSNAVQKGLDETLLFVKHAAAYKQNVLRRYRRHFADSRTLGYGKQSVWSNYVTCWAELALAQTQESKEDKGNAEEKAKAKTVEVKAKPKPIANAAPVKQVQKHEEKKEETKSNEKSNGN